MRLLIGGCVVAIVAVLGWPYAQAQINRIRNQLHHSYCGAPRTFNPIGRREDDYDRAPRRNWRRGEDEYAGGPVSSSRGRDRWRYGPAQEDR